MAISIDQRVDVDVSLGSAPIQTANFDSALFLADLLDADFADPYKVYSSQTEVLLDFDASDDVAKFTANAFAGNFRPNKIYVVKYGSGNTTPLTPLQALTAQMLVDDAWYYVGCDDNTEATVTALVAYCESIYKMFVNSTQTAGAIDGGVTNDILSVLQDASYNHVVTLYHTLADTALPQGGIVGAMAAIPAGVSTLEDKTLVNIPFDTLSTTARTALENKNGGYYSKIAGVNSYFNSKVASGQFLDTIVFSDWLRARLGESIYGTLKRESDAGRKVAYTESGKLLVRQAIEAVIQVGVGNGAISTDIEPVIRIPTNAEISEADRVGRVLPDVVVEVLYSNAVHKVLVRAYVSV
jgi:hypothetical protein